MTFKELTKVITSPSELDLFLESETYDDFMMFICNVANALKGIPISSDLIVSDNAKKVNQLLGCIDNFIDECPLLPQPVRFGNKGFQTLYDKISCNAENLLKEMLPEAMHGCIIELQGYLNDSFGNRSRLDYGTGHEQHFAIFLFCLFKMKFLDADNKNDLISAALVIFEKYIVIMRRIQMKYILEPAGSRGVWGLDDHHFLPFLWGAFQLEWQSSIQPGDVHNERIVKDYHEKYLYLDGILVIRKMKAGAPFGEVAPILSDISAVPNWKKIGEGLVKMYHGEVHRKLPVMQHLLLGSLFSFDPLSPKKSTLFTTRLWNSGPKSMGANYANLHHAPPLTQGVLGGGAMGLAPWTIKPSSSSNILSNSASSLVTRVAAGGGLMGLSPFGEGSTSVKGIAGTKTALNNNVCGGNGPTISSNEGDLKNNNVDAEGDNRGRPVKLASTEKPTSNRDETPMEWRVYTRRDDLPEDLIKKDGSE